MKNPNYNGDPIFLLSAEKDIFNYDINNNHWLDKTAIITISYSKNGVARAWRGYTDEVLATSGGYGYCKLSTILAKAIEELTGLKVGSYGAGVDTIKRLVKERYNIDILEFSDLYQNPKVLQYSSNEAIKRLAKGIVKII